MVAAAPVGDIAVPRIGKLADRVSAALGALHRFPADGHRALPIPLGLMVEEAGQNRQRPARVRRVFRDGAKLLLDPARFALGKQAAAGNVVFQPLQLLLRRHGEEPVDAHAEKHSDLRQQLHIRKAGSALPLAHRLRGDMQRGRERLLRESPIGPQPADLFSHFHSDDLLFLSAPILPEFLPQRQRLSREFTSAAVELRASGFAGDYAKPTALARSGDIRPGRLSPLILR